MVPAKAEVLEDIALHCVTECVRQGVGLDGVVALLAGYDYAVHNADRLPTEEDALELVGLIEPSTRGHYRRTPVTFTNGGGAAEPAVVGEATFRLFEQLEPDTPAAEFVRGLLTIHPFSDGNGRTAFVLLNWIGGTLAEPVALPDFGW